LLLLFIAILWGGGCSNSAATRIAAGVELQWCLMVLLSLLVTVLMVLVLMLLVMMVVEIRGG